MLSMLMLLDSTVILVIQKRKEKQGNVDTTLVVNAPDGYLALVEKGIGAINLVSFILAAIEVRLALYTTT